MIFAYLFPVAHRVPEAEAMSSSCSVPLITLLTQPGMGQAPKIRVFHGLVVKSGFGVRVPGIRLPLTYQLCDTE